MAHLPDYKFDIILMMDVLEHIEKDSEYLRLIKNKLQDNGIILITVPAFQSLYSLHDKELKHFRRYNHKELYTIIKRSGLIESKWTYFYLSLIFGRIITKNKTENLSSWNKSEESILTKLITWVLNTDATILSSLSKIKLHLPGLSLLSICKKRI